MQARRDAPIDDSHLPLHEQLANHGAQQLQPAAVGVAEVVEAGFEYRELEGKGVLDGWRAGLGVGELHLAVDV